MNNCRVTVVNGSLPQAEIDAYVARGRKQYGRNPIGLTIRVDGDYVNLRRTDIESDELNPVALALLPPEIEVGSKLKCEYFQYEIIG